MAACAEVSVQTVSNLVNHRFHLMGEETRVRVERAMSELDYHPNLAARTLRSARTETLCFLLLDEGSDGATPGAVPIARLSARLCDRHRLDRSRRRAFSS